MPGRRALTKDSPAGASPGGVASARLALDAYITSKGLNRSRQREQVLEIFVGAARHLSVDELFALVHAKHPEIGRTTVYRSLKLFVDSGVASELALDGHCRFEVDLDRSHHDHFICGSCGAIFEFMSPAIESLQEQEAGKIGFRIEAHRHQILGVCRDCQTRENSRRR